MHSESVRRLCDLRKKIVYERLEKRLNRYRVVPIHHIAPRNSTSNIMSVGQSPLVKLISPFATCHPQRKHTKRLVTASAVGQQPLQLELPEAV